MQKYNIVIGHYPDLFYRNGGLQVQIDNTVNELKKLGHTVLYYHEWLENRIDIDIYHQFSIDITTFKLFKENRKLAKKIVVSPIFQVIPSNIKLIIKSLNRIPKLNYQNYNSLKSLLPLVDGFVFLGKGEKKEFENYYSYFPENYTFLPNGVQLPIIDKNISFKNNDYVLSVGSICTRKNQLSLINVCKKLNIPLKLIGPIGEESYFAKCQHAAQGADVEFLGVMDNQSKEFISLLTNAKVYALVSFSEVLPISVFEALYAGLPLVCTQNCSVGDYINSDKLLFVNPKSLNSIENAIKDLYYSELKFSADEVLEIKRKFSWNVVAKDLVNFYSRLIEN